MFRVFKVRSVMSLGSWGLALFGTCCGLSAVHQVVNDGFFSWFPWVARVLKFLPIKIIEVMGSILGLFVASYTGVLLASTAVPVWARAKHVLWPLFLASGLSPTLPFRCLQGGLFVLSVWIVAGRASADDPEAVHAYNALGSEDR